MNFSRRAVLRGAGAAALASLGAERLPTAATPSPSPADRESPPIEIRPRFGADRGTDVLRRFELPVNGETPSVFRFGEDERGEAAVFVGSSGLENQLHVLEAATGRVLRVFPQITTAQRGVQELAVLGGGELLSLSSRGCHSVFVDGRVQQWSGSEDWFSDAYDPQVDVEGTVWAGTHGPGGEARLVRLDPRRRTVEKGPVVGEHVDYVRCVSTTRTHVWGGTGSARPQLLCADRGTGETIELIDLPEANLEGNVQWLRAWDDVVALGYRGDDWQSKTVLWDVARREFRQLDSPAYYTFMERVGDFFYAYGAAGLRRLHVDATRWEVVAPADGTGRFPLAATLTTGGGTFPLLRTVYADQEENGYTLESLYVEAPGFRYSVPLDVGESAQKVQTIHGSGDGSVYAAGYLGESVTRLSADLASDRVYTGDGIEQVESMAGFGNEIVLASYPGSRIVRLRPSDGRVTPLAALESDYGQSRPFGLTSIGNTIFVASVPGQGQRGGGIVALAADDGRVEGSWLDVVPDQSIVGLTRHGDRLIMTTSVRAAYGAADSRRPARVVGIDWNERRVVWETELPGEGEVNSPIVVGDSVFASTGNGIAQLDPGSGAFAKFFRLYGTRRSRGYRTTRIAHHAPTGSLIHASGGQVAALHLRTHQAERLARGGFEYPVVSGAHRIYAIDGGRDVVELAAPRFA
ncbi:hypothetical protein [Zhihengliuella salsuginis]|nr:hypothetical protein [Zhihengliuella salsuginis]